MEPGRVLAERYQLETKIGSGGAAVVWRAYDRSLDRSVAIKLLHPAINRGEQTLERFRREARSAASLNHRNAIAIYDIGEDEGDSFIVMEYVSGPSLADLVGRPLEADLVTAVGYQVASALAAAHATGLIHRDVKPANILLSRDGQAMVADFGIAKAIDSTHTTLTQAGSVVGTVAYLAPEQIRGDDVDARADVYALGLVLNEALTGEVPFGSGTPAEVTARRLASDPPTLAQERPELPDELVEIIDRASRLDPADRFADGAELAAALEPLLREEPPELVARLATQQPAASGDAPNGEATKTRRLTVDGPELEDTVAVPIAQGNGNGEAGPPPASSAAEETPGTSTPPYGHDVEGEPQRDTGEDFAAVPPIIPESRDDRPARESMLPDDVKKPILVVVGVAAAILVAFAMFGGGDDDGNGGSGGQDSDQLQAIQIATAQDFDPHGDGEDHREDVGKAHDGDPGTVWDSEHYDTADMGGLKPGVGIWFDLGASHDLSRIELTLGTPGIAFDVFVGEAAPEGTDPAAWGTKLDSVSGAPEAHSIEVSEDVAGRYVLVWITSVGGAGQQAEIAEVRVLGR
ncbi:MAG: serine/threonine-protein kinase [Nitriliruptorales bacterium]|nr:serine/threonine-protein kinase [Nitriliruptorales bacterium]